MLVVEIRVPGRTTESRHRAEPEAPFAVCELQRPLLVAGWLETEYRHDADGYRWEYDHPEKPGAVCITIRGDRPAR